jgi:DNA-binding transcriptional ArsR family regulator
MELYTLGAKMDKERVMRGLKELDLTEEAEILRVMAHPVRLKIAYGLSEVGECNVKEIWSCLGLTQPNVSQHLNLMRNRGLIGFRRRGIEVHYFVKHPAVLDLVRCVMGRKGIPSRGRLEDDLPPGQVQSDSEALKDV